MVCVGGLFDMSSIQIKVVEGSLVGGGISLLV